MQSDVPLQNNLKLSGKHIRISYLNTCIYIISIKSFYDRPIAKPQERQKRVQYIWQDDHEHVIIGEIVYLELCKYQLYLIKALWT
jgi:hypothetical protein